MAQSKKPTKKKDAKTPSKAAKPADHSPAAKEAPQTRTDKILAELIPLWPALTHAQRTAFTARYSDAKCDDMGGRTKSEGVLKDALAWAPIMSGALSKHPMALRRYSPARFAWFLECIAGLSDARAQQETRGGAVATSKLLAEQAQRTALASREALFETLEELVDGNADEEKALRTAAGTTESPDKIGASITALAQLARGWLGRKDGSSKALVEAVGLTLAEVESAESARAALASATAGATMEGRLTPRDTPPVNRAEGRLLCEMKAAMRVFARANARSRDVPKLVPGPATRGVLAPRAGKATDKSTEPPGEPAAAAVG
jgi:hypothetical protein